MNIKIARKRTKEFLRKHGLWEAASAIWHFRRNRITPPRGSLGQILDKYSNTKSNIFFVQIGSNDGSANDPLVKVIKGDHWSGILVEPMEDLFDKLRYNYSGQQGLVFENSAITSDLNGEKDFYYLEAPEAEMAKWPVWYTQLGSFRPEIIERHECRIPNIKKYIKSRRVNCLTFDSLLAKYGVGTVDLLCVDTEGYDYEILKSINFASVKPDIIIYEPIHLKNSEYARCNKILKNNGYMLYWDSPNLIAIANTLDKQLNDQNQNG